MNSSKSINRDTFVRPTKQQGMTLIELLVVLALLTMVAGVGFAFYWSGTNAFTRGGRQSDLQFNLSQTSQFITEELRLASDVEIHASLPAPLDATRRYIYVQNDAIKHAHGATTTVLNENVSGRNYSLSLSKFVDASNENDGRSVDFTVSANESGQDYFIQSQVHPLNLGSNLIQGVSTGPVISYKTNSNRITFFALIKDGTKNTQLVSSVFGYIKHPTASAYGEITIGIPEGISLNDLVATFVTTGGSVKIGTVMQTSGVTAQNFDGSLTDPIIYSTYADDGTPAYYNVRIKLLSSGKPKAKFVGIYKDYDVIDPSTWTTDPAPGPIIAEAGDVVKFAYVYDPNGTGEAQGLTRYELLQNSAANTDTFTPISYYLASPGAGVRRNNIIRFIVPNDGTNYDGKAYQIRVTAVSIYGNEATTPTLSSNQIVVKDSSISYFMMDFVNNRDVLLRYQSTNKASFDTTGVAFTINTTSNNSNGGSNLLKPFASYIPDGDDSTYKILVDAQLTKPSTGSPGGYGVLLGGTVKPVTGDYQDNGYMIQFDPGAGGFLIRKMVNGAHDPSKMYGVDKIYTPADFCYGSTGTNGYAFKNATYTSGNFDWYKRYKTEITVQRQANTSSDMVIRVRIYYTNPTTKVTTYSNDMWFGDFGQITYSQTFNGIAGTATYGLGGNSTLVGDYLGIRTWINGTYADSVVNKFYNIDIKSGFKLFVKSAFIAQDELLLSFYQIEDSIIAATATDNRHEDRNIIQSSLDSSLIKINVGAQSNQTPYDSSFTAVSGTSPAAANILNLGLKIPPYLYELQDATGVPGALDITKNAFKQQYAGFVRIYALGANTDPTDPDTTKPTFVSPDQTNSKTSTITITFSEPMDIIALSTIENYKLSKSLPAGSGTLTVTPVNNTKSGFNPTTVTLRPSIAGKYFANRTKVTVNKNLTDVAGNKLTGSNTY